MFKAVKANGGFWGENTKGRLLDSCPALNAEVTKKQDENFVRENKRESNQILP